MEHKLDSWASGGGYDAFMGRWSKLIGVKFLDWLAVSPAARWLDVGCGTGALSQLILNGYRPKTLIGVDPSAEFIGFAEQSMPQPEVEFVVGSAEDLEFETNMFEAVVSGLVLNFVPEPEAALAEMLRVTKSGGQIGIYLWDYGEGMEMLRYFWDAATAMDPRATALDEGSRFPLCREGELEQLMVGSGLKQVESMVIEVETAFNSFEDYWGPFLQQVGPAPGYTMGLPTEERMKLESRLRQSLPREDDGSISIKARAWAVKGIK
jgi:SAM-dependent methyltransferase